MNRLQRGFTLIELMVVVAIIGVLASVAIPAFMKNARKAKTAEAVTNIRRVYQSSRNYILEAHQARGSMAVLKGQFPETEVETPAGTCCADPGEKCAPDAAVWDASATWKALMYSVSDPHYYHYSYDSTGLAGAGAGSAFTIRARGDLDCDSNWSTFEMSGEWSDDDMDVHGSAGIYRNEELE